MLNLTFEYVNALRNKYTTLDNVCVYSCVCVCYLTMHSIYLLLMVITQLGCCMLLEGEGGVVVLFVLVLLFVRVFFFCEAGILGFFLLLFGFLEGVFVSTSLFWGFLFYFVLVFYHLCCFYKSCWHQNLNQVYSACMLD